MKCEHSSVKLRQTIKSLKHMPLSDRYEWSKITLLNSLEDVCFSKLVKLNTFCNYILQKVKPVATENI